MARSEPGQLGGARGQAEGEAGQRDHRGAEGAAWNCAQGKFFEDDVKFL